MANMGCTGNHPKHLFGDDVARNHSLSSEEESCRLDGETLCLLQKFCAISDKAEQKVVFSNIVPSMNSFLNCVGFFRKAIFNSILILEDSWTPLIFIITMTIFELSCFVTSAFIPGRRWSQWRDCNDPFTAAFNQGMELPFTAAFNYIVFCVRFKLRN